MTLLLTLTAFGPISMDLYLPVLPALTAELGAATSTAQLTITACLVGLALGQLIAGPVSDRFGRRGVLYIGVARYVAASVLCALSPTVELLIAARVVQGMAGGAGIVLAQAAGRDIFSGSALIRRCHLPAARAAHRRICSTVGAHPINPALKSPPGLAIRQGKPACVDPTIVDPTAAIIRVTAACICGSDRQPCRGADAIDKPQPTARHAKARLRPDAGKRAPEPGCGHMGSGQPFAARIP